MVNSKVDFDHSDDQLDPLVLISNLPNFTDGAFEVEFYDALKDLELIWQVEERVKTLKYLEEKNRTEQEYLDTKDYYQKIWDKTREERERQNAIEAAQKANGTWEQYDPDRKYY